MLAWFFALSRIPLHSTQRGNRAREAKKQFLCQRHAQDSAPSAMPSCGIARSYFESRRRQHSCKNRASKFSQNENTQYEQSRQNSLAEQSALPLHCLLQFIEEAPIGTSDNGHYGNLPRAVGLAVARGMRNASTTWASAPASPCPRCGQWSVCRACRTLWLAIEWLRADTLVRGPKLPAATGYVEKGYGPAQIAARVLP